MKYDKQKVLISSKQIVLNEASEKRIYDYLHKKHLLSDHI